MARETGWREIDVERLLGPDVASGFTIEIFKHLGWEDARVELHGLPPFVQPGTGQLTVTSFPPSERVPYCALHKLYGWNTGCPVCANNFIHRERLNR